MSTASQIFGDLADVRLPDRPCHVAVGMFDGVHRGHQAVIEGAVEAARRSGGIAGVFTFWPHPSRLFRPDGPTRLIFSARERRELLLALGVEFIVEQPFTREFAAIPAADFVLRLRDGMPRLATLYVGENWQFGRGRRGDVPALIDYARRVKVSVVSVSRLNYNGEPISSTRIRGLLADGEVSVAGELLGFPYACSGAVMPGRQLGRKIGFPTLNLDWRPDLEPALGVYAVTVQVAGNPGRPRPAVANFGVRPTVEGNGRPVLEVHLLGDCPYGPGDRLQVDWHERLRAEQRFSSVGELREQIGRDRAAAEEYFETRYPLREL